MDILIILFMVFGIASGLVWVFFKFGIIAGIASIFGIFIFGCFASIISDKIEEKRFRDRMNWAD